jgi:hypothetical protein
MSNILRTVCVDAMNLSEWSGVLLENLIVVQVIKYFPIFFRTRVLFPPKYNCLMHSVKVCTLRVCSNVEFNFSKFMCETEIKIHYSKVTETDSNIFLRHNKKSVKIWVQLIAKEQRFVPYSCRNHFSLPPTFSLPFYIHSLFTYFFI